MASVGQVLEEPYQRIEFLETASSSAGERVRCRIWLEPGRPAPPEHSHPKLEERFTVESGVMGYVLGERRLQAAAGEVVVVPPATNHTFWNAGGDQLRAVGEIRPALRFEDFTETIHVLIREGRLRAGGRRANPLLMAVIADSYREEWRLMRLSPAARALLPVLAFIGRRLGYRSHYSAHDDHRSAKAPASV